MGIWTAIKKYSWRKLVAHCVQNNSYYKELREWLWHVKFVHVIYSPYTGTWQSISWHSYILHVLLQEPVLFATSVLENIRYGYPDATDTEVRKDQIFISFHGAKKPLSIMLSTSKNVLFPGHNHLLTTGADDPTLIIAQTPASESEGSSATVVSRWFWPGNRTFLEVNSMVVSWWIVAFLPSV